jgi:hypothetical protein
MGGVQIGLYLHTFLTSAQDGGEWHFHFPAAFTLGKRPRNLLKRRVGGPKRESGCYKEDKQLLPMP